MKNRHTVNTSRVNWLALKLAAVRMECSMDEAFRRIRKGDTRAIAEFKKAGDEAEKSVGLD